MHSLKVNKTRFPCCKNRTLIHTDFIKACCNFLLSNHVFAVKTSGWMAIYQKLNQHPFDFGTILISVFLNNPVYAYSSLSHEIDISFLTVCPSFRHWVVVLILSTKQDLVILTQPLIMKNSLEHFLGLDLSKPNVIEAKPYMFLFVYNSQTELCLKTITCTIYE